MKAKPTPAAVETAKAIQAVLVLVEKNLRRQDCCWGSGWRRNAVHLGYNYWGFPLGQIAVSKLSVYTGSNSDGLGIIDSMISNHNKQDLVVHRIIITRVHCIATARV